MRLIRQVLKTAGALMLTAIIAGAVLFTKPWDDLQSWRFFLTQPVVAWRGDIFTNWGVIQPLAELRASSKPREYDRDLNPPEGISYSLEGRTVAF